MVLRLRGEQRATDARGNERGIRHIRRERPLEHGGNRTERVKLLFGQAPVKRIDGVAVVFLLLQNCDAGLNQPRYVGSHGIQRYGQPGWPGQWRSCCARKPGRAEAGDEDVVMFGEVTALPI
jgi:hypothetical protein